MSVPLLWRIAGVALVVGVFLGSGCGYMKNVRDDWMDVGTFAVGGIPPTVPEADNRTATAGGVVPPTGGVYIEATHFMHVGFLGKATADLTWDRRGAGIIVDKRIKAGLGPAHGVRIDEEPLIANAYKRPDSRLRPWQEAMTEMRDPLFNAPAKTMTFEWSDGWHFGEIAKGWQDWETFSVEVAVPEPFITHSGFYVRAGADPSQLFDAVLSLFRVDLYGDRAYDFDGSLRFPAGDTERGAQ